MNCGIFKQQYPLVESGWVVGVEGLGGGGLSTTLPLQTHKSLEIPLQTAALFEILKWRWGAVWGTV